MNIVNKSHISSTIITAFLIVLTILVLGSNNLLNLNPIVSTLDPDSDQYIQFANQILGRPHYTLGDTQIYTDGISSRPPGYPLMLLPSIYLLPGNPALAIVLTHTFLFLIGLFFLIQATKSIVNPFITWIILLTTAIPMKWFFNAALTEWATFMMLIILFATIITLRINSSRKNYYCLCAIMSLLGLLRPEYVIFIPFVWLASVQTSLTIRTRIYGTILAMAIFSIWPIFNFSRGVGTSSSSPAVIGLFTIASALGPPPNADMGKQRAGLNDLIEQLERAGTQLTPLDYLPITCFNPESIFAATGANLAVAESFRALHNLNLKEFTLVLKEYSIASIKAHPWSFILYFLAGVGTLLWSLPLLLILFWLHTKYKNAHKTNPLYVGAILVFAIHTLRVIFISAINIQHLRYYAPTYFAAALCIVLAMISMNATIKDNTTTK